MVLIGLEPTVNAVPRTKQSGVHALGSGRALPLRFLPGFYLFFLFPTLLCCNDKGNRRKLTLRAKKNGTGSLPLSHACLLASRTKRYARSTQYNVTRQRPPEVPAALASTHFLPPAMTSKASEKGRYGFARLISSDAWQRGDVPLRRPCFISQQLDTSTYRTAASILSMRQRIK